MQTVGQNKYSLLDSYTTQSMKTLVVEDIKELSHSKNNVLREFEVLPVEDTMSSDDGESSKHITDFAYLELFGSKVLESNECWKRYVVH